MGNEHDSWLNNALGIDVDAVKDKAKAWVDEKVDQAKKEVNDAEDWAKKKYEDGKQYIEQKEDDAKKWLNEKKDDIKKEVESAKQAVVGDESGKPIPRPIEADCKPQSGKVPGPKNHIYCGTHGHVLDTDAQQIIAASVPAYVKSGLGKLVKAAEDEAKGVVRSVKKAASGDESGGKIPRPMEQDCKPEFGKVPGPKNHVYCGTHGHVLDVDAKLIIAASVASYVKDGGAKTVGSIDPSSLTADVNQNSGGPSKPSGTSRNPYAGTEHEIYWQQGFDRGFAEPEADSISAVPLRGDAETVFLEGALAGQEAGQKAKPKDDESNDCNSISPSSDWEIQSVAALGGGAGVAVNGIAFILKDLQPGGCSYHMSFMGGGFGGGAKIKGKGLPFTVSKPSGTKFTTQVPVTVKDFNCGGKVILADIGLIAGMGVGRAQLSGFKTTPEWLDIGGLEFAVGASIGIYVGKFVAN